jgi:hypothetical protein
LGQTGRGLVYYRSGFYGQIITGKSQSRRAGRFAHFGLGRIFIPAADEPQKKQSEADQNVSDLQQNVGIWFHLEFG